MFGPVETPVDTDGDGVPDHIDNAPLQPNPDQSDIDNDGIGDVADNAPSVYNPDQLDTDGDGVGDVVDRNTVIIGTLSGGTITANPTTAISGTTINLTITPAPGKRLKAGTLNYNDGTDHDITGTSFIMPGSGVTVTAEFESIPTSGGSSASPKYPVTDANKDTQAGGQTKLSKERAEAGDTVIITITPDKGYENSKPVVLDNNKKSLAITDNGDGTFSFKMPAGRVSVETKFTKIDYFDDVNEDDWFDEASWYCAAHGLMQGTGNRQFDGHMGTNRAMLVTVLIV